MTVLRKVPYCDVEHIGGLRHRTVEDDIWRELNEWGQHRIARFSKRAPHATRHDIQARSNLADACTIEKWAKFLRGSVWRVERVTRDVCDVAQCYVIRCRQVAHRSTTGCLKRSSTHSCLWLHQRPAAECSQHDERAWKTTYTWNQECSLRNTCTWRERERAKYLLVAVLRSNRVRKFLLTQPLEHTRQLTRKFAQFELLVARVVSQIRGLKRKQTFKLSIFFSRNKTSTY